ncbi:MAG: translocation/assembly module TamB domain-containing protein [Nitrospirae bacterium]|nr:translocation/assembly module TamB domain-containing protein [Nitrospirota bacterium]
MNLTFQNRKKIIIAAVIAVLLGIATYGLRGPDISNALKKLILPELKLITGLQFTAQKIYINPFPLFAEMKNIKAIDENGDLIVSAERVKSYISLSAIFKKTITLRKLTVINPTLKATDQQIGDIYKRVDDYLFAESKSPIKVKIRAVELIDADISLTSKPYSISAIDLRMLANLRDDPEINLSSRKTVLKNMDADFVSFGIYADAQINNNQISLNKLSVLSDVSAFSASGDIDTDNLVGALKAELKLAISTLRQFVGLKNRSEGEVRAHGKIKLPGVEKPEDVINSAQLDFSLDGDFYLETLMEMLKVEAPLYGYVNFKGKVTGTPSDLKAAGKASLEKGGIYGVEIDKLNADVIFADNRLSFTNGSGSLYRGSANATAAITLPDVNYYSFSVSAENIESKSIFKLIDWDPGIPKGRVTGSISSEGTDFAPHGSFTYKSSESGKDIIGKVKNAAGDFSYKGDLLKFSNMKVQTDHSHAVADIMFNTTTNVISIDGSGSTSDIKELTAPYYNSFGGSGNFRFALKGAVDDPELLVNGSINNPVFNTHEIKLPGAMQHSEFRFQKSDVDISYKKNRIKINRFDTFILNEKISLFGDVELKDAKMLFDIKDPIYNITFNASALDIPRYTVLFKKIPAIKGSAYMHGKIFGPSNDAKFTASFQTVNAALLGYRKLAIDGKVDYASGIFDFKNLNVRSGTSTAQGRGTISDTEEYRFSARSDKLFLLDIIPDNRKAALRTDLLSDVRFNDIKINGNGSLTKPFIEISGLIAGNLLKQSYPVSGSFAGSLNGDNAMLNAKLLDGKASIKAAGVFTGDMPWNLNALLSSGRYDFIVAHFIKELPDDLLFNAKGELNAQGDKNSYSINAKLDKAHLFIFGNGFTNADPLEFSFKDNKLEVQSLRMRSSASEVRLSGSAVIGKSYDLFLEGQSSLAPMMAFYKNIETLKGDGSFVFTVTGDWEKPKIYGGVELKNGLLGIKYFPYRFTDLNGYAYIDGDKIVIDKSTGNIAGGDFTVSGFAYLSKFRLKKFFVESNVRRVRASISKNFWALMNGSLTYKGDLSAQTILGDVQIINAKYAERLDWKSALLKFKPKVEVKREPTPFEKTALNVRVTGSRLQIDNNVARANISADMLVRGTISSPILLGKAEAVDGTFYFRNNDFKITKGSLDFADPNKINPYFNIAAATSTAGYNIRLNLDGYIDQFSMNLSSDPPLSEGDILSLLAVGQLGKNLKGAGGGIGAGEATSFVTGKLQDVLEDRVRTITGFDRVQIEPYVSKSTGTVSPRITVSKRLMADKLYVTYSSSVNTGEEQIWKLEYMIGKKTSLVGVRDERGALGGDIKFRFEFK